MSLHRAGPYRAPAARLISYGRSAVAIQSAGAQEEPREASPRASWVRGRVDRGRLEALDCRSEEARQRFAHAPREIELGPRARLRQLIGRIQSGEGTRGRGRQHPGCHAPTEVEL